MCVVYDVLSSRRPGGVALNSSYKNRENESYKNDLGRTLINVARMCVLRPRDVPHRVGHDIVRLYCYQGTC